MSDMVPSNATDKNSGEVLQKDNGLNIEYVEIKLPTTCLNGNIYQRKTGIRIWQRDQSWK